MMSDEPKRDSEPEFQKGKRKGQAWFWEEQWQEREREANEDIAKGNLSGPFQSAKELVHYLRSLTSESK
jgi:hypothetical protein